MKQFVLEPGVAQELLNLAGNQMNSSSPGNVQNLNRTGFMPTTLNSGVQGRRPANIPAMFDPTTGKMLDRYSVEKRLGLRRPNGALKLKRLTARHMKIIALHIQGLAGEMIAQHLNCSYVTVSRILNDPLSVDFIARHAKDKEAEISALMGTAVQVVRTGMTDKDLPVTTRLKAVDRFTKLLSVTKGEEKTQTAEDVIAKMLERANFINSNIQINLPGHTATNEASTPSEAGSPGQSHPTAKQAEPVRALPQPIELSDNEIIERAKAIVRARQDILRSK